MKADTLREPLPPTVPERATGSWTGLLLALVMLSIAVWVMHHELRLVQWEQVRTATTTLPLWQLAAAVVLTIFGMTTLGCYDVLATRLVAPGQVTARQALLTGSAAFSISNLVGFAYLSGGAVRSKVYRALGLDMAQVIRIIAMVSVGFWLGLAAMAGLLLASGHGWPGLPDATPAGRIIGTTLLVLLAGLLLWLVGDGRTLTLGKHQLALPAALPTLAFMVTAVLDLLVSGLVLWVLLPAGLAPSLPPFLMLYLSAIMLGIASSAPGGIGVFEATMLAGLSHTGSPADPGLVAALGLFRLVYYLLPFLVTVLLFAILHVRGSERQAASHLHSWQHLVQPLVPLLSAACMLLLGVVLLLSGVLPAADARLELLRSNLPLFIIETSHLANSVIGVLLIVLARALYLKRQSGWKLAMLLMAASIPAALLKGANWEAASMALAGMLLLWSFRSAFYRRAPAMQADGHWLFMAAILLAATVWIGFLTYAKVPYSDPLWWHTGWQDDASHAARFLRSSLAVALTLAVLSLNTLLNASQRLPAEPIPDAVRRILANSPVADARPLHNPPEAQQTMFQ